MIFIGHSIQKQQNTFSSQGLMEYSRGQIISWVTKQALVNLRKLKSYQISFGTTKLWDYISITGKKMVKNTNTWSLNNSVPNNQEITEEIKEEIKYT